MYLTSPAFQHERSIPVKYTCDGDNINPPLQFEDVPDTAQSLVLIMEDPDVPKNLRADGMWDHWVLFNIEPTVSEVKEGQGIAGTHLGVNTSGKNEYQGPCPPDREHRYFFKLYALDVKLDLDFGATKKEVEEALKGHVLGYAELIGLYDRNR